MAKKMENDDKFYGDKLKYFMNHPMYGKYYKNILDTINCICHHTQKPSVIMDYCAVFLEIEKYVNRVQNAEFPEIEVTNIHTEIIKKEYANSYPQSDILKHQDVSSLMELLFLVIVFDAMPNKSDALECAFSNCRAYLEQLSYRFIYTRNNLWSLVAERIKPSCNYMQEDYQVLYNKLDKQYKDLADENKKLEETIVEYQKSEIDAIDYNDTGNPHQKVILELLYHFMDLCNADFTKWGSKKKAAYLFSKITNISVNTCRNYITARDLNRERFADEIMSFNQILSILNIEKM